MELQKKLRAGLIFNMSVVCSGLFDSSSPDVYCLIYAKCVRRDRERRRMYNKSKLGSAKAQLRIVS